MRRCGAIATLAIAGITACSGPPKVPPTPAPTGDYTAIRWIPAQPTYAFAARSVRDLQRTVTDVLETFGIAFEVQASDLSRALTGLIAMDAMKPAALASIGIDPDGGIAVFSESVSPTFVVELASTEQFAGFIEQQRGRGLAITSQILDGQIEVFTAKVSAALSISWAAVDGWLWVRFGLPIDRMKGTAWLASSRARAAPTWTGLWNQAAHATSRVAGFVDVHAVLRTLPKRDDLRACTGVFAPVQSATFALAGDGTIAKSRIAFDIGVAGAAIATSTLPPPEGWDRTSRGSAFALQWNLDVIALAAWARPCIDALVGADALAQARFYGVRTARAIVRSFDPDALAGTGAVALDIEAPSTFAQLLDRIPLRSTLEADARFGPWAGKTLSVPLGPTIDYVLTDKLALVGVGEGMLARAVGKGPGSAPAAVLAIDLLPAGLSGEAWQFVLGRMKLRDPKRAAERLQRWREIHVTLVLDGTRLVLETAAGRK